MVDCLPDNSCLEDNQPQEGKTMLPRPTYRKACKILDHYRKQHETDRVENPNRIPIGWKSSITSSLRILFAEDRIPGRRDTLIEQTIALWVQSGMLVSYHGDVTFPGYIPTREEIEKEAKKIMEQFDK